MRRANPQTENQVENVPRKYGGMERGGNFFVVYYRQSSRCAEERLCTYGGCDAVLGLPVILPAPAGRSERAFGLHYVLQD